MNFNIDNCIILGFLGLNLIIGLTHFRNIRTIKDYSVGKRQFSDFTLTATLIATWMGGSDFSVYVTEIYENGLTVALASCIGTISFPIIAYIYAPRMRIIIGKLSIGSAMNRIYGYQARNITALVGLLASITALAAEFKFMSIFMMYVFAGSALQSTVISAAIIMIYSSLGGIRGVLFTDSIQFLTFGIILPFILFMIYSNIDDILSITNIAFNNHNVDFYSLFDISGTKCWQFISLCMIFAIPGFSPSTFQRIALAKNIRQVKRVFVYSGVVIFILRIILVILAIILLTEPNFTPNNMLNYIFDNYSSPGLTAICIICILSMIMSSADSEINSSSIIISHDLLYKLHWIRKNQILKYARISSILLGSFALFIAITFDRLFEIFMLGYSFYMPVVTMPFTFAIFGFKMHSKSALAGMLAGFSTSFIWLFIESEMSSVVPGMTMNALVMILHHYLTPHQDCDIKSLTDRGYQLAREITKTQDH